MKHAAGHMKTYLTGLPPVRLCAVHSKFDRGAARSLNIVAPYTRVIAHDCHQHIDFNSKFKNHKIRTQMISPMTKRHTCTQSDWM